MFWVLFVTYLWMFWFDRYRRVKAYSDDICFYSSSYLSTMVGNVASESPEVIGYISATEKEPGLSDSEKKKGFGLRTQWPCLGPYPPLEQPAYCTDGVLIGGKQWERTRRNSAKWSVKLPSFGTCVLQTRRQKIQELPHQTEAVDPEHLLESKKWLLGLRQPIYQSALNQTPEHQKELAMHTHIKKFHWDPACGLLGFICRYFSKLPDSSWGTNPLGTFSTCHMNGYLLCQPMAGSDQPTCLLENVHVQGLMTGRVWQDCLTNDGSWKEIRLSNRNKMEPSGQTTSLERHMQGRGISGPFPVSS